MGGQIDFESLHVLIGFLDGTSVEEAREALAPVVIPVWLEPPANREPESDDQLDTGVYVDWSLRVVADAAWSDVDAFEAALKALPAVDHVELTYASYGGMFATNMRPITRQAVQQRTLGHVPGRNEPCPCGSGRKFKRCHAA